MTPAARVQAAIGLFDAVIASALAKGAPADRILAEWFKANRYAGSKDRRANPPCGREAVMGRGTAGRRPVVEGPAALAAEKSLPM